VGVAAATVPVTPGVVTNSLVPTFCNEGDIVVPVGNVGVPTSDSINEVALLDVVWLADVGLTAPVGNVGFVVVAIIVIFLVLYIFLVSFFLVPIFFLFFQDVFSLFVYGMY
jgi:hypothetical protein